MGADQLNSVPKKGSEEPPALLRVDSLQVRRSRRPGRRVPQGASAKRAGMRDNECAARDAAAQA